MTFHKKSSAVSSLNKGSIMTEEEKKFSDVARKSSEKVYRDEKFFTFRKEEVNLSLGLLAIAAAVNGVLKTVTLATVSGPDAVGKVQTSFRHLE